MLNPELLELVLDQIDEAVLVMDGEARIVYWNRASEELMGWESDEVLGENAIELMVPGDLEGTAEKLLAQIQRGETWSGNFWVERRDGTEILTESTQALTQN